MRKAILIFLTIIMLLSVTSCSSNTESSENTSSEIVQTVEPTQLVNKMTETELSRVDKHELTLLDVPQEPTTEAEPAQTAVLQEVGAYRYQLIIFSFHH